MLHPNCSIGPPILENGLHPALELCVYDTSLISILAENPAIIDLCKANPSRRTTGQSWTYGVTKHKANNWHTQFTPFAFFVIALHLPNRTNEAWAISTCSTNRKAWCDAKVYGFLFRLDLCLIGILSTHRTIAPIHSFPNGVSFCWYLIHYFDEFLPKEKVA